MRIAGTFVLSALHPTQELTHCTQNFSNLQPPLDSGLQGTLVVLRIPQTVHLEHECNIKRESPVRIRVTQTHLTLKGRKASAPASRDVVRSLFWVMVRFAFPSSMLMVLATNQISGFYRRV